jgi:hypothetical protein
VDEEGLVLRDVRRSFVFDIPIAGSCREIGATLVSRNTTEINGRGPILLPLTGHARWWDNPTMVITLDAKRRLTVPAALAPAQPGDYFDAHFDAEEDTLVFRRLAGREDWLEVLKACPVSPDDVPPRRRASAKRRKL